MKVCMIATTPYQVLSCISIVKQQDLIADLYLGDLFNGSNELYHRIKKLNIFNNTYLVDQKAIFDESVAKRFKKRMKMINLYRHIESVVPNYINFENNYDCLFVSSNALIFRLAYLYCIKYKKNIKICIFDEGIGTYCNPECFDSSLVERVYQRLLLGINIKKYTFTIYVYSQELFHAAYCGRTRIDNVIEVKALAKSMENDTIMNTLFHTEQSIEASEMMIILDTTKQIDLKPGGVQKIIDIYNTINNKYSGNVICKSHPKDTYKLNTLKQFEPCGIPFEYYCYTYNDMNSKVLISLFSTAAFTPKVMYKQEPICIYLCEILKDELTSNTNYEATIEYLKGIYKTSRVYLPKSVEELYQILNSAIEKGSNDIG